MRMDLAQREVAIHIAEGIAVPAPQLHDDQLQSAGVGTLVVAVHEDRHRARSTHVVLFCDGHRHLVIASGASPLPQAHAPSIRWPRPPGRTTARYWSANKPRARVGPRRRDAPDD